MKKITAKINKPKSELEKILLSSNWQQINVGKCSIRGEISKNNITLSYYKTEKKEGVFSYRIIFRIGEEIIKALGWKGKDRIVIFQDKDYLFNFKLVKTENGSGHLLQIPSKKSKSFIINFKWNENVPLDHKKNILVEHEIFNKSILVIKA